MYIDVIILPFPSIWLNLHPLNQQHTIQATSCKHMDLALSAIWLDWFQCPDTVSTSQKFNLNAILFTDLTHYWFQVFPFFKFIWCRFCIYQKLILGVCCWKIQPYFLWLSIGIVNLQIINCMRLKGIFSIQSFDWYRGCSFTNLQFFQKIFFNQGSLTAIIKHCKGFHFSTGILMLHCHWHNIHTDHTSFLVNRSTAEIFCFCASIWPLTFLLFPIIIFSRCFLLHFVLITIKSSWMIVLTFFIYNSLGLCICWIVIWNRIIAPKTEFIFGHVPASLLYTELQKCFLVICIVIFLTHVTWALTLFHFHCYVCLGFICFHYSVSVIWPLSFVHETVKRIPRKHRVCYRSFLFLNKVRKIYKFCIPLSMHSEILGQSRKFG